MDSSYQRTPSCSTWLYRQVEPTLWTVGFFAPDGLWLPESDHGSSADAAARVHWLNGGNDAA